MDVSMLSIELTRELERCEHLIALAYSGNVTATIELWTRIVNLENDTLRVVWIKRFTELINPQAPSVWNIKKAIAKVESI
ncbi:hypothetical protein KAR91_17915 [Candidatus Pacearchaeota archaeon]|nr:hypothetical protein [Candidatus Pacearchaeota archaeon]